MHNKIQIIKSKENQIEKILLNGVEIRIKDIKISASVRSQTEVTITLSPCEVDVKIPEFC
jgi:hypothetical protein